MGNHRLVFDLRILMLSFGLMGMTLFEKRSGQCMNVFEVDLPVFYAEEGKALKLMKKNGKPILAKTSIDIVWGDKDKNVGLEHIVDDHYVSHNDFNSIEELQERIIKGIQSIDFEKGTTFEHQGGLKKKFIITNKSGDRFLFSIQSEKDDKGNWLIRHFILTSYDKSTPEVKNSKEERERRQKIFDSYGKEKPK